MASRFDNKPDPSIKKNVLRSRAAARKAKSAHASVVVTSLLATLLAWATFSSQEAPTLAQAQATSSAQASTLSVSAPQHSIAPPATFVQSTR